MKQLKKAPRRQKVPKNPMMVSIFMDCASPLITRDYHDFIGTYRLSFLQRVQVLLVGRVFIRIQNSHALRQK